MEQKDTNDWDIVISSKRKLFDILFFSNLIKYKDLILMFVKRDFVTFYKQTILGPLWYVIQPLVNTIVFTIIFGNLAKLPTDGMPPFIFYMAGTIAWSYFSVCLQATSNTFVKHEGIFGKIYFPRLTIPISHIIISLLQFAIQPMNSTSSGSPAIRALESRRGFSSSRYSAGRCGNCTTCSPPGSGPLPLRGERQMPQSGH